jgi:hypothetical protein
MSTVLVDPNQKYWDLGLGFFNAGDAATTAMQRLWGKMPPPASLNTLATIIGALWGDTYWDVVGMSASRLSSDLQAALGLNKPDCDRAAQAALAQWHGLLVRGNMGDSGNTVPRPGDLTQSPDVVVNGAAQLTVEQLIRQWNTYIYTPQPGLKNNTYGRAASTNIMVPITKPVLRMFYSDAGFNPPPTSWIQMFTFDGADTSVLSGIVAGPIPPGGRAANVDSFAFTPAGSGHYCLIAVAGTEFFANNPLTQMGNWSSQSWIQNNGAAGWHNVDVSKSNGAVLKFFNQDGTPERFVFEAHGRNLPTGTTISLACEDPALSNTLAAQGRVVPARPVHVGVDAILPPRYEGKLAVRFDVPGGKLLPPEASVEVRMYWVLPAGHEHYSDALAQSGDAISGPLGRAVRIQMGSFTFVGA